MLICEPVELSINKYHEFTEADDELIFDTEVYRWQNYLLEYSQLRCDTF